MINPQQQGVRPDTRASSSAAAASVGSLFVPSRVGGQPPAAGHHAQQHAASVIARIASFQPSLQGDGDAGGVGLLLPPQRKLVHAPAPVPAPVAAAAAGVKPKLRLSWAGSGIYFFWQLGAVQYLMNKFHLAKVPMVGASGGGLAAVLAACEVAPEEVLESAYAMSLEHNIWGRPLGLVGTWGELIQQWLHDLLPADAAERCHGQVGIVVTQLPFCNQVVIDDYQDKADLINVAMASAHVPMFLDWKLTRECRGVQCLDGSFPDFFVGENCDLLQRPGGSDAVMFDYFHDPKIVRNGRMDMLSLKQYKEFKKMIVLGYKFAQRLDEAGEFDRFEIDSVRR